MSRLALGVSYRGTAYSGWQAQSGARSVQEEVERALASFMATGPVRVVCAGRTDAGVHGLNQVVHLDTDLHREPFSWVRGTNRFLPADVAIEWCRPVPETFSARASARGRRYVFVVRESAVRPALDAGLVGWVFRPLNHDRLRQAAAYLIGEHDFSAFRSSECQALSPVKTLKRIDVQRVGDYWRFDFDGTAFLHHMIRNIMGCLVAVGSELRDPSWMGEVLASRNRTRAAPTFPADGLYFAGPYYDAELNLPLHTAAMSWLPGGAG